MTFDATHQNNRSVAPEVKWRMQAKDVFRSMSYLPLVSILLPGILAAQPHQHEDRRAILLPGAARFHHPISTRSAEAQAFFDQGLTMVYGFNRPEAVRSFRRAAELDPKAAMPHWGIALASGQHVNMDLDGDLDAASAYQAIQKALSLAASAPEHERRYIEALAKRCARDPKADRNKLALDYAAAMRELARRYPDDPDAAILFAEGLMCLRPWNWWTPDGKPAEWTEEAAAVIEGVLLRHPQHPGANHLYVHVIEQSPNKQRAFASARRLFELPQATGHLVHMAAHIFLQTGDYDLAARANEHAVELDRGYMQLTGESSGPYVMGYYPHNIHFIVVARMAQGRFDDAWRAATQLAAQATKAIPHMPEMADYFMPNPLFVLLRFQKWDEILAAPAPDPRLAITKPLWHFARAMALKAQRKQTEAEAERALFEAARKAVPASAMFMFNTAENLLKVPAEILASRMSPDAGAAIEHWKRAVAAQDALAYDEPPAWFYPVRESLGGELLRMGQASEAEAVFRADLQRSPRNGRSLFGLMESLRAQEKTVELEWVKKQFDDAWKQSQVKLRVDDL